MRSRISQLVFFGLTFSYGAHAYVAGSVATPPETFDASVKLELMRGTAGPENLPETQQKQKPSVNIYGASVGYNFGTWGALQDFRVGLSGALYSSKSEELNGSAIYPSDDGGFIGVDVSANFIHEGDRIFGFFVRNQNPIQMNVAKFVNPKIDHLGIGLSSAFKFNPSFGQEALIYLGSGVSDGDYRQNPSLSVSLLAGYLFTPKFLGHEVALKAGPFFDADIAEHGDSKYNTTVRSFRAGLVGQLAAQISERASVNATYVQKFSGAYFRATKDFILEIKTLF